MDDDSDDSATSGPGPAARQAISDYVDAVEAHWLVAGVASSTRRRLATELEAELLAAVRSGAPLDEVIATDPVRLARDVALAEGETLSETRVQPVAVPGLAAWGIGSAVVMAAFVWSFGLGAFSDLVYSSITPGLEVVFLLVVYGLCGAVTLGAAVAGMSYYARHHANRRSLVRWASIYMGAGGAVGVGVCVVLARLFQYSSAPSVILIYTGVVASLLFVSVSRAWRRAELERPDNERVA